MKFFMKIKIIKMKKNLIILSLIIFSTFCLNAQNRNREKLNSFKTSYITNVINLTPSEAEKFWPVYNLYSKKIQSLRILIEGGLLREINETKGIDNISNKEADAYVSKLITLENDITANKISLIKELSKIISAKKILKLQKAEKDFNRKILQEYGKRKRMQNQ